MSANFDGSWAFSAELQPNKNTKHVNDRKNNKKTSNQEQISEKEEQTKQGKNKSKAGSPLTDHQRSIWMDPSGQQQEEEHTETTYGRFLHW